MKGYYYSVVVLFSKTRQEGWGSSAVAVSSNNLQRRQARLTNLVHPERHGGGRTSIVAMNPLHTPRANINKVLGKNRGQQSLGVRMLSQSGSLNSLHSIIRRESGAQMLCKMHTLPTDMINPKSKSKTPAPYFRS
jgi:hypothetical protein